MADENINGTSETTTETASSSTGPKTAVEAINAALEQENIGTKYEQKDTNEYNKATGQNTNEIVSDASQVNSRGLTNTGSGSSAALDTLYSWNESGTKKAQSQYATDVANAKSELLTNRQTINENANSYQTQADMQIYTDNQSADKVGWTGGYVLDSNRQRDYLAQSIQAQLYGAMELQKYGYDTSLSAARLSYEMNQMEYAQEYYNDAVTNAINEASMTGIYFSPEAKEMLDQWSIASNKLDSNKEDKEAETIKSNIEQWFVNNQVSPEGIKTADYISSEVTRALQVQEQLYEQWQDLLNASKETVNDSNNIFYYLDPTSGGVNAKAEYLDLSTANGDTLYKYLIYGGSGVNTYNSSNIETYIESQITAQLDNYATNHSGTETVEGWQAALDKAYNNTINKLDDAITAAENEAAKKELKRIKEEFRNNINNYLGNYTDKLGTVTVVGNKWKVSESEIQQKSSIYKGNDEFENSKYLTKGETNEITGGINLTNDNNFKVTDIGSWIFASEPFKISLNGSKYSLKLEQNGIADQNLDNALDITAMNSESGGTPNNGTLVLYDNQLYLYSSHGKCWYKIRNSDKYNQLINEMKKKN